MQLIKDTTFKVWAVSDWHLQHKKLLADPTTRPSNYETLILENYDACVTSNDLVIFLGDIMFQGQISRPWFAHITETLPGYRILVKGNHDDKRFKDNYWLNDCGFKQIHENHLILGNILFSHFPITRNSEDDRCLKLIEHLNRAFILTNCTHNIHGHVHHYKVPDHRCICACPEQTNYRPINVTPLFEDLTEVYKLMEAL